MANSTTSRNICEKFSDPNGQTAKMLSGALAYLRAGLSIVPIKANSKAPSVNWTAFQTKPPTENEVKKWFEDGKAAGIGIVCGKVSGNLELLDLERIAPLETFAALVEQRAPGLLTRLPRSKTPSGGRHIVYRCEKIEKNQKLAMRAAEVSPKDIVEDKDARGKTLYKTKDGEAVVMIGSKPYVIKTMIETRGEGGQFLSPLCPPGVHPSGGVYELINGDLLDIPTITQEERAILFQSIRACNEYVRPVDIQDGNLKTEKPNSGELRPGDDYNQRGDVRSLLNRYGWRYHSKHARGENWSRPGVNDHCGATLFDDRTFYVYSSNAEPLTELTAYTPFALHAFLECDGDFKKAAKELAAGGYGAKPTWQKSGEQAEEDDDEKKVCGAYEANKGGLIYWQQTKDGIVPAKLTNFRAEIVADVVEDDGAETKRAFEVSARLNGKAARFIVPAEDFAMMKWPMVNLGAKAVIYPRRMDHARCAIQMLSDTPTERRIYTHTGWREIDGEMCYLHGGGAIGAKAVKDVEVKLPDSLTPAVLPEPLDGEAWAEAMSAVFDLMLLAPEEITIPAIGAAFSSVIGGADFSIWLYGPTGSGKSELAALIQSFFGRFSADKLPGSWMSTANANEVIAHAAKDMVCAIDDFKPTGSQQDRNRLMRDADRLCRAQGNQQGRHRLSSDAALRGAKPPRGLIFNTAEEKPVGESLLARLFVLECHKTSIDFSQLTALQKSAADGVFASAMSGFVRWLSAHNKETIGRAPKELARLRDEWARWNIAEHKRHATALGHLSYAWSVWIKAAKEAGALTEEETKHLWERVWRALSEAGSKQDSHRNAQNPVTRFLELLQSAFASQRAHLEHINGGPPAQARLWGWRLNRVTEEMYEAPLVPCGDRIGWHTGEEIYLLPDATFAMLERFSASGEGIGVQQTTLWKHLHEAGILTERDEKHRTYPVRRSVTGSRISVLVLRAENILCVENAPHAPQDSNTPV